MTGLPETKYIRIFPIQEIDQTRRLRRDWSLGLNPRHPWWKVSARTMRRLRRCCDAPQTTALSAAVIQPSVDLGGFAFAVQPHREVTPESGLVGIVEHIVVNKKVTAPMWYRLMS